MHKSKTSKTKQENQPNPSSLGRQFQESVNDAVRAYSLWAQWTGTEWESCKSPRQRSRYDPNYSP